MNKIDLLNNQEFIDETTGESFIANFAIVQGASYQISFIYAGDTTMSIPKGQIRTKYAQDENILLADFSFGTMSYDLMTNETTIIANLSATQTAQIPYTKYQGIGTPSIRNCHVYDMELTFPSGIVEKLSTTGFVQVLPEVTVL
jgi:hypothetical protein